MTNQDDSKPPRPPRPKDAASLIIYRKSSRGLEVLLGRRPSESRFMPDILVYPGGVIDAEDSRVQPATPLPRRLPVCMAVSGRHHRAQTLAMAAVRETFEETGCMLTLPGDVSPGREPPASWRAFHKSSCAPHLACLHYVGRAITPTTRPLRFHARFFAVNAENLSGSPSDSDELRDVGWYAADDDTVKLVSVTRFMLNGLIRIVARGDDAGPFAGGLFYTHRNGRPFSRDDAAPNMQPIVSDR